MKPRAEPGLALTLRWAERLLRAASAFAVALDELPGITLPPAAGSDVDQAQLRAVSTLYLAAELEEAGVIPAAEALANLARSGGLPLDFGDAAPLIEQFWEGRNQRASPEERHAFFAGLFGTYGDPSSPSRPINDGFEDRFIDLCESLYKLDGGSTAPVYNDVASQARVRATAQGILDNLAHAAGTMTVFIAQDILNTTRSALAMLGHAAIRAAFGGRTLWDVVATIGSKMKTPFPNHELHVRRGQSGMTILAWLADAAPAIAGGTAQLVALDSPAIAAAADWLEASLSIGETGGAGASAPSPVMAPITPATGVSPWAGLAS